MSIGKIFWAGGVVMVPLLLFSILAIALVIERSVFWFKINKRQRRVVRDVLNLYQADELEAARAKLQQNINLPISRIFLAALSLEQPKPENFRLALETEAQAEIPLLKRFNVLFETIISLAPLLGLLGTVLGLIASFASLNVGDVGGSRTASVTAGISEALVSTAAGLIVAIFTLMFANTFRGFYIRQIAQIQEYSGQLELLYSRRYDQQLEKSYASTR
jgi:biopolymer transport protein ExbB